MNTHQLTEQIKKWCEQLKQLPLDEQVATLNAARKEMHEAGPFRGEPVDCIYWVKTENIEANDYNPNSVAPPEMELLRVSSGSDGYTQPIVSWMRDGVYEVVDGFHRNRVGREYEEVRERIKGYLPLTVINGERTDRNDRIASTIRHNRARGSHNIELMSSIVAELVEMGKGDRWICKHIGMSADELLRLKQITGLAALFQNREFSKAWEADHSDISENEVEFETTGED